MMCLVANHSLTDTSTYTTCFFFLFLSFESTVLVLLLLLLRYHTGTGQQRRERKRGSRAAAAAALSIIQPDTKKKNNINKRCLIVCWCFVSRSASTGHTTVHRKYVRYGTPPSPILRVDYFPSSTLSHHDLTTTPNESSHYIFVPPSVLSVFAMKNDTYCMYCTHRLSQLGNKGEVSHTVATLPTCTGTTTPTSTSTSTSTAGEKEEIPTSAGAVLDISLLFHDVE